MATIAKLNVILDLNDNAFQRGLANSKSKLDSWGSSLRNVGGMLTTGITLPIIGAGGAMIKWASDLDESMNKTQVIFGDATGTVLDFANGSSKSLGMSKQATLDFTSSFAGMLQGVAKGPQELANMSTGLTGLTADFASFHNLNPEEAFTVISSALAGETEAIRKYGVDVSAAAVEQKAMEMGLAATTGELTEQDKALARYQLILEGTTEEQGDFERTANSTSNRLKIMRARIQDIGAAFGKLLLPAINRILGGLGKFFDWLEKIDSRGRAIILIILGMAAAAGPLIWILGALVSGLGAMLGVVAFLLSPIGLLLIALAALAYVFRGPLGEGIEWVGERLHNLMVAFDQFRQFNDPVTAMLKALALWFPAISDVIQPLIEAVGHLKNAFSLFKEGRFGEAFREIWEALKGIGAAIQAALAAIDWSAIVSRLGDLAAALVGWLWEQVSSIDWGGTISAAASASWDGIVPIADATIKILAWSFEAVVELSIAFDGWIRRELDKVNWHSIGEMAGEKVRAGFLALPDAMRGIAGKIIDGFREGITDPMKWAMIGLGLLIAVFGLPLILASYAATLLLEPAKQIISGFVDGLNINWMFVMLWFATIGSRALEAVGDLAATLVSKGTELVAGLLQGAQDKWLSMVIFLALTGMKAFNAVGSLTNTLVDRGTELIAGLLTGAVDKWLSVFRYLSERGAKAYEHVGSLTSTLYNRGLELIEGMITGVKAKWVIASSWLTSIPGKAVNAVGSLGRVLYNAGASLIQGLIDGISSKIESLKSKLGEITGLIPNWKGPASRDAKLLFSNGVLIMGGLGRGLDHGWDGVTRQLSGYTSELGSDFGSDMSGSGSGGNQPQVIQIITLEPGKWKEFLDNAMAGGDFAKNFGGQVAAYGGLS